MGYLMVLLLVLAVEIAACWYATTPNQRDANDRMPDGSPTTVL